MAAILPSKSVEMATVGGDVVQAEGGDELWHKVKRSAISVMWKRAAATGASQRRRPRKAGKRVLCRGTWADAIVITHSPCIWRRGYDHWRGLSLPDRLSPE